MGRAVHCYKRCWWRTSIEHDQQQHTWIRRSHSWVLAHTRARSMTIMLIAFFSHFCSFSLFLVIIFLSVLLDGQCGRCGVTFLMVAFFCCCWTADRSVL